MAVIRIPPSTKPIQSPDPVPGYDDRSHTDKAHAADDLRSQPVHIGKSGQINLYILLRQHHQRSPQTDYRDRLRARSPVFHPPVQTDDAAQHRGHDDPDQYVLYVPCYKIA